MGKPRLIILIRHAQSEGNKNREIHQTVPDHRVKLTSEGQRQAVEAGKKLRALLRPDDTLHFYTSPYRRTRETTEGILSSLTSDNPTPSPFPRHTIKVYEEPRLREQDFGNFQPDSAEMQRMWQERADYGHFFYRIPNGESAADAYDRVSGFNESLWRSFGEDDFASVCVLVTHGLMTRVFLMKWYHWSVEYFEDLRNINHCEFVVMQQNKDNGKYILKNQLRTWTQYQAEKAAAEEERKELAQHSPIPTRKRWGGCPDGSDQGQGVSNPPRRQNTADLFKDDGVESMAELQAAFRKKSRGSSISESGNTRGRGLSNPLAIQESQEDDEAFTEQELAQAPSSHGFASPSRLSALHAGRDGGGSKSGNVSSDDDEDDGDITPSVDGSRGNPLGLVSKESQLSKSAGAQAHASKDDLTRTELEERTRQFRPPRSMALALNGQLGSEGGHAKADALGDQSDIEEEEEMRDEETRRLKEEEGRFEESVR